jgi:hypothetical protein
MSEYIQTKYIFLIGNSAMTAPGRFHYSISGDRDLKRTATIIFALLGGIATVHANETCDAPGSIRMEPSSRLDDFGLLPGTYVPMTLSDGSVRLPVQRIGQMIAYIPLADLDSFAFPYTLLPNSPLQLTCGSPDSTNAQAMTEALDLDFDFDGHGRKGVTTSIGSFEAGAEDGARASLSYRHVVPLSGLGGARLAISVPLHYVRADDVPGQWLAGHGRASAWSAGVRLGLQIPLSPNWWITPAISYTAMDADRLLGGDGEMTTSSLSTNGRIPGILGGEVQLAGLVGYSRAVRTGLTGQDAADYSRQRNGWLSAGIAYQAPMGRDMALRTDYSFTHGGKDSLAYDNTHRASLMLKFLPVSESARAVSIGLTYVRAEHALPGMADYKSLSLTGSIAF